MPKVPCLYTFFCTNTQIISHHIECEGRKMHTLQCIETKWRGVDCRHWLKALTLIPKIKDIPNWMLCSWGGFALSASLFACVVKLFSLQNHSDLCYTKLHTCKLTTYSNLSWCYKFFMEWSLIARWQYGIAIYDMHTFTLMFYFTNREVLFTRSQEVE